MKCCFLTAFEISLYQSEEKISASKIPQVLKFQQRRRSSVVCYLNVGSGDPWAGQVNAKGRPCSFLKIPKDSDIVENLGLDEPIGSAQGKAKRSLISDAWTNILPESGYRVSLGWASKTKSIPSLLLKGWRFQDWREFWFCRSNGLCCRIMNVLNLFVTLPKWWNRGPLSWANQSKWCTKLFFECLRLRQCGELGFGRANRFCEESCKHLFGISFIGTCKLE